MVGLENYSSTAVCGAINRLLIVLSTLWLLQKLFHINSK